MRPMPALALAAAACLTACKATTPRSDAKSLQYGKDAAGAGTVYAELRRYEKSARGATQALVFIDMGHAATPAFYAAVLAAIAEEARRDPRLVVLREGVYCSKDYYDVADVKAFDPRLVEGRAATPAGMLAFPDEASLQPLIAAGLLRRETCNADGTSAASAAWNASECAKTHERGLVCQREAFDEPLAKAAYALAHGDVDESAMPLGDQLLMHLFAACDAQGQDCWSSKYSAWLNSEAPSAKYALERLQKIIIDDRNAALVKAIGDQAAAGRSTFVIPWGANHMAGLYELATSQGFALKDTRRLPFAKCAQPGADAVIQGVCEQGEHPVDLRPPVVSDGP